MTRQQGTLHKERRLHDYYTRLLRNVNRFQVFFGFSSGLVLGERLEMVVVLPSAVVTLNMKSFMRC